MKVRVRMALKASAKGIVQPDVTVDCELEESEAINDVGSKLNESVKEFEKQVSELGYKLVEK